MKSKFLKICSVAVLLLVTIFTLSACGKKDNKPIATIEGFDIETINIFHVADDYNLEIGITNTNNEEKVFDFSNIILKQDSVTITHNGNVKEYQAGQYYKWTFKIDVGQGLNVGDVIEVYYNEQKLTDVTVEEF